MRVTSRMLAAAGNWLKGETLVVGSAKGAAIGAYSTVEVMGKRRSKNDKPRMWSYQPKAAKPSRCRRLKGKALAAYKVANG